MKLIERKCLICGKSFIANTANKMMCSQECADVRIKNNYYKRKAAGNVSQKEYVYKPTAKCRICGKLVYQDYAGERRKNMWMHEECVYKDCAETIRSGKQLSKTQYQRLIARGYTLAEFRADYMAVNHG